MLFTTCSLTAAVRRSPSTPLPMKQRATCCQNSTCFLIQETVVRTVNQESAAPQPHVSSSQPPVWARSITSGHAVSQKQQPYTRADRLRTGSSRASGGRPAGDSRSCPRPATSGTVLASGSAVASPPMLAASRAPAACSTSPDEAWAAGRVLQRSSLKHAHSFAGTYVGKLAGWPLFKQSSRVQMPSLHIITQPAHAPAALPQTRRLPPPPLPPPPAPPPPLHPPPAPRRPA